MRKHRVCRRCSGVAYLDLLRSHQKVQHPQAVIYDQGDPVGELNICVQRRLKEHDPVHGDHAGPVDDHFEKQRSPQVSKPLTYNAKYLQDSRKDHSSTELILRELLTNVCPASSHGTIEKHSV